MKLRILIQQKQQQNTTAWLVFGELAANNQKPICEGGRSNDDVEDLKTALAHKYLWIHDRKCKWNLTELNGNSRLWISEAVSLPSEATR